MEKSFKNQLWRVPIFATGLIIIIYGIIFISIGHIPEINPEDLHTKPDGFSFGLLTLLSSQIPLSRIWDIPLIFLLAAAAIAVDKWIRGYQDYIFWSESSVIVNLIAALSIIVGLCMGGILTLIPGLISGYIILIVGSMLIGLDDSVNTDYDVHEGKSKVEYIPVWFRMIIGLNLGLLSGLAIATIVGLWIGMIAGIWLLLVSVLIASTGTLIGVTIKKIKQGLVPWLKGE